jgi:succinate dehydrogenase/fumarate reductase-like Fe-S protein
MVAAVKYQRLGSAESRGQCSRASPAVRFLGPAVLLQAHRWIMDSRDKGSVVTGSGKLTHRAP